MQQFRRCPCPRSWHFYSAGSTSADGRYKKEHPHQFLHCCNCFYVVFFCRSFSSSLTPAIHGEYLEFLIYYLQVEGESKEILLSKIFICAGRGSEHELFKFLTKNVNFPHHTNLCLVFTPSTRPTVPSFFPSAFSTRRTLLVMCFTPPFTYP